MSKDFPDPKKIPVPSLDGEETVIGVHASGIQLEEGLNTSTSRNYCSNCRRNIHCYVKVDKQTREAKVHITCKNTECECKCKTHFACRRCGHLHPYGQKCDYVEPEPQYSEESNTEFEKILQGWRDDIKKKSQDVGEKKE